MWGILIFYGTAGLFLFWMLSVLSHLRWVRRLPVLQRDASGGGSPEAMRSRSPAVHCSVVIAARNEETRIEQTIRRLLDQRGVAIEVMVVDDRSTDRTGMIVRRLAGEDSRVRMKRVEVLPDGWLGKCHACHVGAAASTGDWILFTDADCWMKSDVLTRALRVAETEKADHITLVSGLATGDAGLKASHLMFLLSLADWISGVNRDRPKSYLGIGAFNLVRSTVYRECGGYEALRLTVLDDMRLGLLLRRAGGKTRGYLGGSDVECDWGNTAWSIIELMEKNYFAAVDFRVGVVAAGSVWAVLVLGVAIAGLASGTIAGVVAGLSPFLMCGPAAIVAGRLGWGKSCVFLIPFTFPLFLYAVVHSAFVTLRQGGIWWRDTFYSLDVLRAGNVR